MPLNNPPQITLYTSGIFTGNDGANRAIPHGLKAIPKVVLIAELSDKVYVGFVKDTLNVGLYSDNFQVVTGWDAVNFYVSNTTVIFNDARYDYSWVAFA